MTTDWIPLKEAAALMKQNEKKLRARTPDGGWKWFPELARIQPGGRNSQMWLLRSEIEDWIRRVEENARRETLLPPAVPLGMNEALIDQLRRMGAHKTIESIRAIT